MKKLFLIINIFLLINSFVFAQEETLTGLIFDQTKTKIVKTFMIPSLLYGNILQV